jgi:hypothetical protein
MATVEPKMDTAEAPKKQAGGCMETAGPCWMRVLYIIVALGSFGWFLYNLVKLAQGVTDKKVTDVHTIMAETIAYPDIYICLPAHAHFKAFRCCEPGCTPDGTSTDDAGADCGSFATAYLPYSCSTASQCFCPSLQEHDQYDMASSLGSGCQFTKYVSSSQMNHPYVNNWNMGVGPELPYGMQSRSDGADYAGPSTLDMATYSTHEYAIGLANRMPTFIPPDGRPGSKLGIASASYCWYYKANIDAVFNKDEHKKYLTNVFATTMTQAQGKGPTYFEVYMMAAGQKPYEGDSTSTTGRVLATKKTWPGIGSKSVGSISVDFIKDKTKGETEFTPVYHLSVITMPMKLEYSMVTAQSATGDNLHFNSALKLETDDPLDPYLSETDTHGKRKYRPWYTLATDVAYGMNSFTVDSFFVREVTTRYQYSIYDVWAAIGGLYGGSLLILSMLFTVTTIPELTEVKVFRLLPPTLKKKWLGEYGVPSTIELQAEITELRAESAQMRAQMVAAGITPKVDEITPLNVEAPAAQGVRYN